MTWFLVVYIFGTQMSGASRVGAVVIPAPYRSLQSCQAAGEESVGRTHFFCVRGTGREQ